MFAKLISAASISLALSVQLCGALVTINTNNAGDVAGFQLGATIENFDALTGQNTVTDGTPIAAASQLADQLKASKGIFFTSGGNTPIAVLDLTGLGPAHSAANSVAPIEINTDLLCSTGTSCFMEVFFTGANSKFGAWFDHGDARMIVFWTDNTSEIIDVAKGNFAGAFDSARTIDHVTLFGQNGGPLIVDDMTYAGATTTVPEPSSLALLATGALALGLRAARSSRRGASRSNL